MRLSKRQKLISDKVEEAQVYSLSEAVEICKSMPTVKFNETLDISINLGVDPKKSDQNVRGSSSLPHGIGKTARVAVFADGQEATYEDLIEQVKKDKNLEADIVIATPDCMKLLGQLGRILGPKNLMPNPKEGTVTKNIKDAVKNAKKGQIRYKTDKAGIIHAPIGKMSFESEKLVENAHALIDDLIKAKPASAKGKYMKNITISSTMGPGIKVDLSTVEKRG